MAIREQEIFKNGSSTYYFSSKFFPANVREDVFRLYSFVRVVDDYVDQVPADRANFLQVKEAWFAALANPSFDTRRLESDTLNQRVVKNSIHVLRKYDMDPNWFVAFWQSMHADLQPIAYQTLDQTLDYVYGSAEVIGLMMAKIMGLPEEAMRAARLQGRAMQFINFLRDIEEDNALGRCYFPIDELRQFKLNDLSKESAYRDAPLFESFMRYQLARYNGWQKEALEGFSYIPRRLRIPLKTAVDMYTWTGQAIEKNPLIVFEHKVRPRKRRVLIKGITNGRILLPGL